MHGLLVDHLNLVIQITVLIFKLLGVFRLLLFAGLFHALLF
jgi:hypothetical protein